MTEFRAVVEPQEKMRGLEVPETAVEELGGGRRPRVSVTVNGHSWETRVAIMLGRNLIGLSNANRAAAGLVVGDEVTVRLELATEPVDADVPDDVAAALDADQAVRGRFDALTVSQRRQHVRVIDQAKTAPTRQRRIAKLVEELGGRGAAPA
ncbi:YdeI/OmpD-associated family protein [Agromyces sp. Marseille-Q5079]|uniref:YdeI/OmpD-associated family protein n=1 Tax=Agromyces sp. Marseille-Q5079 TaxID=3439059 RepID=UPI003D9CBD4F